MPLAEESMGIILVKMTLKIQKIGNNAQILKKKVGGHFGKNGWGDYLKIQLKRVRVGRWMTWTWAMLQVLTCIRNLEDNSFCTKMLRCRKNNLHCCVAACIRRRRQSYKKDRCDGQYTRYE